MTVMSHLPRDLVEEILSRVPITSLRTVRSTCKGWNSLSKDRSFAKKHCGKAAKENLAILICDYRCCLMSVNLHGIHNNKDMVGPFMRMIGNLLNDVLIDDVIHSDGLLLFVTRDKPDDLDARLVVWNPYLGQARWILPSHFFDINDNFSIGHDNNNNHKILRFSDQSSLRSTHYEIYNFKTNSWKDLDVTPDNWSIWAQPGIPMKGNTYYVAEGFSEEPETFLLCFDFTKERFGQRLHLPFDVNDLDDIVALSSGREEQLTLLHHELDTDESEIWFTTKIEPNAVLWTKLFVVEHVRVNERFFIDQEKKLVVIWYKKTNNNTAAYMLRENGYWKEVYLVESKHHHPFMCSYVPSLVQIQQGPVPAAGKRKERDY